MLIQASIVIAAFVLSLINAQSIEVTLAQQKKVSYFTSFLQQNPDIIDLLNTGVHTGPPFSSQFLAQIADTTPSSRAH